MTVTITWQSIITAAAVISAAVVIVSTLAKIIRRADRVADMEKEIERMAKHHEEDVTRLEKRLKEAVEDVEKKTDKRFSEIYEELTLICYGLQACLKGLQEQGCDGPVADAIDKMEKHINQKAHKK